MKLKLEYMGYAFNPDDPSSEIMKDEGWKVGDWISVDVAQWRVRTDQQRKAIEVYCRKLAHVFTEMGLDMRQVFNKMREGVDIPWTQDRVKDVIWREIQIVILNKKSTARLSPEEVTRVYEVVNKFTARMGVSL